MTELADVWVFNGASGRFPSGVFSSKDEAEAVIKRLGLTGTLTKYPVGQLVYEWALQNGAFTPKSPNQSTPEFIGKFSSAAQEHYHYEGGI